MRLFTRLTVWTSSLLLLAVSRLWAEESLATSWVETIKKHADEAMYSKTVGGRQFWGDVHHFQGWRIQQNVFSKDYRLIDPDDLCHTLGSFDDCHARLKRISAEKKLAPMKGPAVILIHGLLQSSRCMVKFGANIEKAGYSAVEFDYPSTQVSIPEAARYLNQLIQSLDGIDEINFVTHSMGGLVVRAYTMEYDDPRIKRMVMLGTPNQGAELADLTQQYWILRTAAGPGGRQLGTRTDGLIPKLPIPKFEFAVIAGSRGTPTGWNPLIPGDDDGTVTVASTKLPGAADFTTVYALHSRLLWSDEAHQHTINFLKNGRLRAEGDPQPIREDDVDASTVSKQ
ncbi:MAG: alpha/beta fold hydrolase [Schlesneria sp.]